MHEARVIQRQSRADFAAYIRTGVRLDGSARHGAVEVKFNPWHDPDDGRFTFSGAGRYFGAPGGSSGGASGDPDYRHLQPNHPNNHSIYIVKDGDTLTRIAGLRKGVTASDLAWLNRLANADALRVGQKLMLPKQSYLDAGREAKNRFLALSHYMDTHGGKLPPNPAYPPSLESQLLEGKHRRLTAGGYDFDIDPIGRQSEINATLRLDTSERSRGLQAAAGGSYRQQDDDGGHYIAVRFGGPKEAFNHFAQHRSFNRGDYRVLEDQWAKALDQGESVVVKIVPRYEKLSGRPYVIEITSFIKGKKQFRAFNNGPKERK